MGDSTANDRLNALIEDWRETAEAQAEDGLTGQVTASLARAEELEQVVAEDDTV